MKGNFGIPTIKRIAAIFFSTDPGYPLAPKDVYQRLRKLSPDLPYSTVLVALHRLVKRGILRKGPSRGSYYLANRAKCLGYIGKDSSKLVTPSSTPLREFFSDFIDFNRMVLEKATVEVWLDGYNTGRLREWLEGRYGPASRGDRSKKLSHSQKEFGYFVTNSGYVRFTLKTMEFFPALMGHLAEVGLDEGNQEFVVRKFLEQLRDITQITVEAPLLVSPKHMPKGMSVKTRFMDKEILTRFTSTHWPAEIEISGYGGAVLNFVSALSGVQHFSPLEYIQAQQLAEINQKFGVLSQGFRDMAKELKTMAAGSEPAEPEEKEEESEPPRSFYG